MVTSSLWLAALAVAVLAILAAVCERISRSSRIPDIVLFLLLGIFARPVMWQMLGVGPSSDPIRLLLLLGAAVLVFEGGRAVDRTALREVYVGGAILATLGVLLSFIVVAAAVRLIFGIPWSTALLAGAILAATDPASVAPVLQEVRLVPRLKDLLLLESAANDATSAALAVTLHGGIREALAFTLQLIRQVGLGMFAGGLVGLGLRQVGKFRRGAHWRSTLSAPAALFSYGLAGLASASGFMASFTAGVVGGTSAQAADPAARFARAVRAAVFIVLGASLNPALLLRLLWPTLGVVLALLVIGRPLTVLTLLLDRPRRWSWREIAFAAWVRETGVVPAALAAALTAAGGAGSEVITALVFMTVLLTIVLQAATTRRVAALLGVLRPEAQESVGET